MENEEEGEDMEGDLGAKGGERNTGARKTKERKERNTEERQRRATLKRRMGIAEMK